MRLNHKKKGSQFHNAIMSALAGADNVFLFDNAVVNQEDSAYRSTVIELCRRTSNKPFEISGEQVNEESLLACLSVPEYDGPAAQKLNGSDLSNYRLLCAALEHHRTPVVIVHHAEKLSDEAIHILARLASFSKRMKLSTKYMLFADQADFGDLALMQLNVDRYYPIQVDKSRQPLPSSYADLTDESRIAGIFKIILPAAIAGIVILFGFQYFQPSDSDMSQPIGPDLTVLPRTPVDSGAKVAERRLQDTLQAMHESRIRDFEFKKALDEIEGQSNRYGSLKTDELSTAAAPKSRPKTQTDRLTTLAEKTESKTVKEFQKKLPKMSEQMLIALASSDAQKVKQLYAAGESLNAVNDAGETALAVAVITNKQSLTKQLIDFGVSVNTSDQSGHSPLFYAAIGGSEKISLDLLNAGAQVNKLSALNKTPLMAATHNGHEALVSLFINRGAKLNLQDHSGWSALQYATWNNNLSLVKLLLEKGANPSLKDNDGYDAIAIAALRSHTETMALIQQKNS